MPEDEEFGKSDDIDIVKLWPSVQAAYAYLVDNPKFYDTEVSLDVSADWARFGLDSPGSIIKKGSIKAYGVEVTSSTSVGFVVHSPVGIPWAHGARVE